MEDEASRHPTVHEAKIRRCTIILAIWGEEKTGKTALSLSFPDPLVHFDFDYGYGRVAESGYGKSILNGRNIVTKPYLLPLQLGDKDIAAAGPLWNQFTKDYLKALDDKSVQTIVLDTGTQLWEIIRLNFLHERRQKDIAEGKRPRDSILQVEYGEPNAKMRSVYNAARSYGKNLVVTHYERDEYKVYLNPDTGRRESAPTGEIQLSGFGDTPKVVDMIIFTYKVEKGKITSSNYSRELWSVITTSGLGIDLCGQIIQDVTYKKIVNLQKMLKGEV